MGRLRSTASGEIWFLEAEHVVGRSPHAALRLRGSYISSQHATIRWSGAHWHVKDLGSRNGTSVNGARLTPGAPLQLDRGMRVSFGRAEQEWELIDDSAPQPMVIPVGAPDEALIFDSDMLPLPSANDVAGTLLRCADGSCKLEQDDAVITLQSGESFELKGRWWRLSFPASLPHTSTEEGTELFARDVQTMELGFRVSSDEEHVELFLVRGHEVLELGSRTHNYLLLILARQRLSDVAHGLTQSESGWMYRDDVMNALKIDRERLNIDIFRIRKQFAASGVPGAAGVIERRPDSKQLRLGLRRIRIQEAE